LSQVQHSCSVYHPAINWRACTIMAAWLSPAADDSAADEDTLRRSRQFSKTKLCKFNIIGMCAKGVQCPFAHSKDELKPLPDLTCTKLCKTLIDSGECTDRSCKFAHTKEELRSTSTFHKTKLCRFSQKGHCALGAKCNFAHSVEEVRQLEADIAMLQDIGERHGSQMMQPPPVMFHTPEKHSVRPSAPDAEFTSALVPGYLGVSGMTSSQSPLAQTKQAVLGHDEASKQRAGRRAKARLNAPGLVPPRATAAQHAERGLPSSMPGGAAGGLQPSMAYLMAYSKYESSFSSPSMSYMAVPSSIATASASTPGSRAMGFATLGPTGFKDSPAYVASGYSAETAFSDVHGPGPFGGPSLPRPVQPSESARSEALPVPVTQFGNSEDLCTQFEQMLVSEAAQASSADGWSYADWRGASEVLPRGLLNDYDSRLLRGGSFQVDQSDDRWQVKNTFLTLMPQSRPIRAVRTADGALCSLGGDMQ